MALAYSGAIAGLLKGIAVHSAFNIPIKILINLKREIRTGAFPLSHLSASKKDSLMEPWSVVKVASLTEAVIPGPEILNYWLLNERVSEGGNVLESKLDHDNT